MFATIRNSLLICAFSSPAAAQVEALPLQLAQACFLESGWSEPDCAAIVGVLQRRAGAKSGVKLQEMLWAYSALKSPSPRSRLARGLPAGDFELWSSSENRAWARLRAVVHEVLAGLRKSPCPRARHWGARDLKGDVQNARDMIASGSWIVARCREATLNAFYKLTSRADRALLAARPSLPPDRGRDPSTLSNRVDAQVASGSYRRGRGRYAVARAVARP